MKKNVRIIEDLDKGIFKEDLAKKNKEIENNEKQSSNKVSEPRREENN
jgi:hypothetical protein